MIKLENVTKEFKKDFWSKPFIALDDVSFEIPEGQIVGYLGANGAGKTTSLKIILGFIKQSRGQIHFSEVLGKDWNEIISNIGYLPERPYFYPHLSGREFITFMGRLSGVSDSTIERMMKKWSERLRIDFALDREIKGYSKGMLQRLGFTTALVHDPKLVILDEPVSGLDPIGRKEIKDAICEINKEGKTIFFSSHIVPDIEEICHSIVFLEKGKLNYQGPISNLLITDQESYNITFRNKSKNEIINKTILLSEKERFLSELNLSENELISLTPVQITLEESLYKVKGFKHESI
jgi:ABC-2 type transport system ATP-binding protein